MATGGNSHLGGDDFDKVIMDWLMGDFYKKHGVELWLFPEALQRVREAAEQAKIELSSSDFVEIKVPYIVASGNVPLHLQRTLTRRNSSNLSSRLLPNVTCLVRKLLAMLVYLYLRLTGSSWLVVQLVCRL